MTELTPAQLVALTIARTMVRAGIPIFVAPPNHGSGPEFLYPKGWETTVPDLRAVERWRPGWALCAVTGVVTDVIDTDPRNGGVESREELIQAGMWPRVYGIVSTPGGGTHEYIGRTHVAKAVLAKGVDLQAGQDNGEGRGFVFLPPTERRAKGGQLDGHVVAYRWTQELDTDYLTDWGPDGDESTENITFLVNAARSRRRPAVGNYGPGQPRERPIEDDDPFDTVWSAWTQEGADRVIQGQLQAVESARDGTVNSALGGAARLIGRFVAGGYLEREQAESMLLEALARGGVHSDAWNLANGRSWTAATVIAAGMANGLKEPWEVMITQEFEAPPVARDEPGIQPARLAHPVPDLCVTTAAEMTYWLQGALGSGSLSGFFARGDKVVHTPRVDEAGYVPPREERDENGPAMIAAVTPGQLTAKIQYAHRCYKIVKNKKTDEEIEVPALFPLEAARRAIDAPEAMVMLRKLHGITHTPMVRADGTILDAPGYDPASGYLFLPGPGVKVRPVPEVPSARDVESAVELLDEMVAGFPWETKEDKANYYGLLLTPLLRMLAPPSYKAFFIGAHQPGSGKTLLADVARALHGGVFRSDMPVDEKEIKSMTTSLLATTSAPVIQVDNVTGVLRSSYLAGLLTASGEIQERELGKSSNLEFTNDRVWVFTGNNPSLGGDMVRRTITIMIDPNMANPETREFAIQDLGAWVIEHRNKLLHALMVMIRHWVASGKRMAVRRQSDSFATWEATVAGILAACGVIGEFDAESGKRAAAGGDDDGLAALLDHIYDGWQAREWSVAEMLAAEPDEFRASAREWLPSTILDKLARSEEGGRRSLGRWLLNRVGRWVTTEDGTALVIREAGKNRNKVALWRVEARPPR